MRILVLSTFDVWPAKDGGQTRYVGLWSSFPEQHDIQILAYEFRNLGGTRRYRLGRKVQVVVPPADPGDARHFSSMMDQTGLWLHDVLCLRDYYFSDEYLRQLRAAVDECDVLVASHPYLAHVAFPMARTDVVKVYESHNVEYDIKARYFEGGKDRLLLSRLLEDVWRSEAWAAQQAQVVTAVSTDDASRLIELYGLPPQAVHIVPNGADIRDRDLLSPAERDEARQTLGLAEGQPAGIFLGSAYEANVVSYKQARTMLEDSGFTGTILLVGSIRDADRTDWPDVGFEERWFGFVDEELRDVLLASADFALQLMFTGAGTNLKLFDYMSAGVPIIANAFGRRGVEGDDWFFGAGNALELRYAVESSLQNELAKRAVKAAARSLGLEKYDWKAISGKMALAISVNATNNY